MALGVPLFGLLTTWLTPIWLLAVGVSLGAAVLGIAFGLARLLRPPLASALVATVREALLVPVFYLVLLLAAVALLGTLVTPYRTLFDSALRLGSVGPVEWEVTVPPATLDHPVPLKFRASELHSFELLADRPLAVDTFVVFGAGFSGRYELSPGKPVGWSKQSTLDRPFTRRVTHWLATSAEKSPTKLTIRATTDVEFPEVRAAFYAAAVTAGLLIALLLVRTLAPRVAAIAATTAKESAAQPLFLVLMAIGAVALVLFIYLPYNTFGEDVKLVKTSGTTLIMVLAILSSVWSASVSVADEIEGHTALTVLSKPIRRWQFILGKFLGTLGPAMLMFILLGTLFLVTVSFKVVYDARESAQPEPSWQLCYDHMISTLPALALGLMETVVLASISVALSTRLPMAPNLIICASIYALGHLTPVLVQSAVGRFEPVVFVGQLIATVLPVLDYFNVEAGVNQNLPIPASYLGAALLYSVLYSAVAFILALYLFEERDLA